jgi:hypothetical protein
MLSSSAVSVSLDVKARSIVASVKIRIGRVSGGGWSGVKVTGKPSSRPLNLVVKNFTWPELVSLLLLICVVFPLGSRTRSSNGVDVLLLIENWRARTLPFAVGSSTTPS